ncbi:hypothetical protein ANN_25852 [Periplaneta americana]|uniref:Uncharacterized protein n=1 Tax=Periplaneta americana TaxID=6978 RepID=A0ABQ8S4B3_PERAM|nr:hypothetical protein ANN_25852 [Periplaneta americana]
MSSRLEDRVRDPGLNPGFERHQFIYVHTFSYIYSERSEMSLTSCPLLEPGPAAKQSNTCQVAGGISMAQLHAYAIGILNCVDAALVPLHTTARMRLSSYKKCFRVALIVTVEIRKTYEKAMGDSDHAKTYEKAMGDSDHAKTNEKAMGDSDHTPVMSTEGHRSKHSLWSPGEPKRFTAERKETDERVLTFALLRCTYCLQLSCVPQSQTSAGTQGEFTTLALLPVAYSYTQPFLFPYLALDARARRQGQKNVLALTSLTYRNQRVDKENLQ